MDIEPVLYEVSAPQLPIEESTKPIEIALLLLEQPIPLVLEVATPLFSNELEATPLFSNELEATPLKW